MLLVAKDRKTARAIGMELAKRNVVKTYIAAGFDRTFSKKYLPNAGIIRSGLARVCDALSISGLDGGLHGEALSRGKCKCIAPSVAFLSIQDEERGRCSHYGLLCTGETGSCCAFAVSVVHWKNASNSRAS